MDFLVLGAQKSATSWLYYCLREHPALCLPAVKREVEYIGGALYEERGPDWYFDLVARRASHQQSGDVSVEYLYDARSAPLVAELLPNAKLIASLRHPIDRAVSAYYWFLRKGRIPNVDLAAALEQALTDAGSGMNTPFAELLSRGYYGRQLDRYLRRFPPQQVLVLAYDDIQRQPLESLESLYGFIGVSPGFRPGSLNSRPKHNTFLHSLVVVERLAPHSRWVSRLTDLLNNTARRLGITGERDPLPDDLRRRLEERFVADGEQLVALVRSLGTPQSAAAAATITGWYNGSRPG